MCDYCLIVRPSSKFLPMSAAHFLVSAGTKDFGQIVWLFNDWERCCITFASTRGITCLSIVGLGVLRPCGRSRWGGPRYLTADLYVCSVPFRPVILCNVVYSASLYCFVANLGSFLEFWISNFDILQLRTEGFNAIFADVTDTR